MVRLSGTGRVADDLYFLAHHEVTGKPFLQRRTLGIGLACIAYGAGPYGLGTDGRGWFRSGLCADEPARGEAGVA